MAFNTKQFLKQKFEARTEEVEVKALAPYFPEGEEPVFSVRGLDGHELAKAEEAKQRIDLSGKTLESFLSGTPAEKIEALKKQYGLSDDIPMETAKRIEMLVIGAVNPKVDLELAAKLVETFPIEFYQITNAITRLTGMGSLAVVKQPASGKIQE